MDEPKIGFEYEQQVQRLYGVITTHVTVGHTLQRRTSQPSFIASSSLPTYDSQGALPHTPKQISQFSDMSFQQNQLEKSSR